MKNGLLRRAAIVYAILVMLAGTGCERAPRTEERQPQQAGQPLSVVDTAASIAKARAGAAVGDATMTRDALEAMSTDVRRSMRLPDPARPIDREHARAVAKGVDGVRSVVWLDQRNLLAMVERNELRSQATIDAICLALEPLGDTLAVTKTKTGVGVQFRYGRLCVNNLAQTKTGVGVQFRYGRLCVNNLALPLVC